MHFYQVLLLLCSMVWADTEEGSTPLFKNTAYGRPSIMSSRLGALHGSSISTPLRHSENGKSPKSASDTHSHVWKMFITRAESEKRGQKPPVNPTILSDQQAIKNKLYWERAARINRGNTHPTEILSIAPAELTRAQCQALPFIQNIYHKNCRVFQIPNRFCFGQCNSFYLPGWQSPLPQPCEACTPSRSRKTLVTLRCNGGTTARVLVEMVEECECMTRYPRAEESEPAGSGEGFLPL